MPRQTNKIGKGIERLDAADSLFRKYIVPALGGAGVTSSWQGLLSALNQPSPPWWVYGLIAAFCAIGIVLIMSRNKKAVLVVACVLAVVAYYALAPQKLEVIAGRAFINQEVPLDGFEYNNCRFENVTFVYRGGPGLLVSSVVNGATFRFDDEKVFNTAFLLSKVILLDPNFAFVDSDGTTIWLRPGPNRPSEK